MTQVRVKAAVAITCVLLGVAVPAAADTVEVAAVGLTFQPPDVIIIVGDSVHWTGLFGGFHTVAEVDDALAFFWNGGFHSPAAASEFTFTFIAPGLYHYICEPHVLAGMRGTVTVDLCLGDDASGDTDADGICDDIDNCELFNPDQADCQPNGVGDVCDIADGAADDDGNGIPDECEGPDCGPCPWDADGNGVVSAADLAEVLACWATPHDGSAICTCLDTSAGAGPDGNIKADDLADLLAKWSGDLNGNDIPDACPGG